MSQRFISDFESLSHDLRQAAMRCLEDFKRDPLPPSRRPHSVTPRGQKPAIYTMDVTPNKSHKLSYKVVGNTAYLLRVAAHKALDRDPGRAEASKSIVDFV